MRCGRVVLMIGIVLLALCPAMTAVAADARARGDEGMALMPNDRGRGPGDFLTYYYQPQYDQMVRKAVVAWPQSYDFRHLRTLYSRTRQYDPLGEDTLARLSALSYAVETARDPKEKERKAGEFQDLVLEHLASPAIVFQALSLARENRIYGDPAFYEWVAKGLEDRVMNVYNGRSMKQAVILITLADEALFFNRLGAKSVYSELVSDGAQFYYIHLAEDLKTGKQFEVYTNASIPMRVLKARHSQKTRPVDLRYK